MNKQTNNNKSESKEKKLLTNGAHTVHTKCPTNSEANAEAKASHNMTWKTRRRDIDTRAEKTRVLNAICAPSFVNVYVQSTFYPCSR